MGTFHPNRNVFLLTFFDFMCFICKNLLFYLLMLFIGPSKFSLNCYICYWKNSWVTQTIWQVCLISVSLHCIQVNNLYILYPQQRLVLMARKYYTPTYFSWFYCLQSKGMVSFWHWECRCVELQIQLRHWHTKWKSHPVAKDLPICNIQQSWIHHFEFHQCPSPWQSVIYRTNYDH